jgi:hypothetical protein
VDVQGPRRGGIEWIAPGELARATFDLVASAQISVEREPGGQPVCARRSARHQAEQEHERGDGTVHRGRC